MALPAPTAIADVDPYFVAGTREYVWVPTIANKATPTTSEISAGTNLTGVIATVSGFDVTTNMVEVPNARDLYNAKVAGRGSSSDSSFDCNLSKTSTDIRELLTQDLEGFVIIFPEGIHTSNKMDVYPVRVVAPSKDPGLEGPGMIKIGFAITSKPVLDLAIPTA